MSSLVGARDDRKVTLGITESSRPRVHTMQREYLSSEFIDGEACYIDVGFSYPSCAEAAKGAGVHRLKGIMSWVQNAVRQFV